jgi:hypothetical protein
MVQGGKKLIGKAGVTKSKSVTAAQKARHLARLKHKTKKGNPSVNQRQRVYSGTASGEEEQLSKVIAQSNEEKVAAKLVQAGGRLSTVEDLHVKGKDINKARRREEMKKKVGRTEAKLLELKAKDSLRDQ